jgi:hypothetical protein
MPRNAEDVLHEVADQSAPLVGVGRSLHCRLEPGSVPTLGELTPRTATPGTFPFIQLGEELLVAELIPVQLGVLENVVRQIDARQRRGRVKLHDVIDVAAEDRRLHVPSADHVVQHKQELLVFDPFVLAADLG